MSCRLDDPGMSCVLLMARPAEAGRCCLCHSPALRPWIAAFGVLRGGDLEPGALALPNYAGKSSGLFSSEFGLREAQRDLSLSGGTSIGTGTFQAGHHLLVVVVDCLAFGNKKGDPSGSPLPAVVSCARDLASTPRGKGDSAAVLALQIEAMPARHDRRGRRRFGDEVRCVD